MEEIGGVKGLCDDLWVACGDFNTTKFISEKKNATTLSRSMKDFSKFIEDAELVDPPLNGGTFTWARGGTQRLFLKK